MAVWEGRSSARKDNTKVKAGEHDHSNQIGYTAEAESSTGDKFDVVIGRLGVRVGEFEPDGGNDGRIGPAGLRDAQGDFAQGVADTLHPVCQLFLKCPPHPW